MGINRKHILTLVGVSLIFKLLFMVFNYFVLFETFDTFDMIYYYKHAILLLSGQVPYLGFGFDYPPLALFPMILSYLVTSNFSAFYNFFSGVMCLCDLITAICIYLIALEIYGQEKLAFRAALVYATGISIAYYTLTKFDAFPTMLLVIALLFTIQGAKLKGYYTIILGILTKIFPLVISPFIFLYNAKKNSMVQEARSILWQILIPLGILIPLTIYIFLSVPRQTTGSWSLGLIFVNTPHYTLYTFLHDILGFSWIPLDFIIGASSILCIGIFLLLLYSMYSCTSIGSTPRGFLTVVLIALFSFIFLWSYHSPQYIFWYMPLVCILIADDLRGILLYYFVQIMAFIEFPQMPGWFYSNTAYLYTLETNYAMYYLTWGFFVIYLSSLVYLVYRAVRGSTLIIPYPFGEV